MLWCESERSRQLIEERVLPDCGNGAISGVVGRRGEVRRRAGNETQSESFGAGEQVSLTPRTTGIYTRSHDLQPETPFKRRMQLFRRRRVIGEDMEAIGIVAQRWNEVSAFDVLHRGESHSAEDATQIAIADRFGDERDTPRPMLLPDRAPQDGTGDAQFRGVFGTKVTAP